MKEINAEGGSARFLTVDLADADEVRALAAAAGDVDILVNNAGIYLFTNTPDTSPDSFDRQFAINTRAPFLLVGASAPGMAARGHGTIVNGVSPGPVRTAGTTAMFGDAVDEIMGRANLRARVGEPEEIRPPPRRREPGAGGGQGRACDRRPPRRPPPCWGGFGWARATPSSPAQSAGHRPRRGHGW